MSEYRLTENQEKARSVMNVLHALENADAPKSEQEMLISEIARLRDAFLDAVPDAYHDDRFAQMMGSPLSVVYYVTKHFQEQEP